MVWAVAAKALSKVAPKALKLLRSTSVGKKLVGGISKTSAGKIVASSGGSAAAKITGATRAALGPGGAAAVGKVGTRMTTGIAKMPRPARWAADLTGVKGIAGGMARIGTKTGTLGKVKTAAMLGGGALGAKFTYGLLKPGREEQSPTVPDPQDDGTGETGTYDYNDEGDVGGTNEITGEGYREYLKNPIVQGALAAAGLGIGAVVLKKALGKGVVKAVISKVRGGKKKTTTRRKTVAKGKGKFTFKALAARWKKLSKSQKAKYENQFSAYIKVHREKGITAKTHAKPRRVVAGRGKNRGTGKGRNQSTGVKKQQNKMRAAAKKWKSYKGSLKYQDFIKKELRS